jgi:GTPase
MHPEIRTSDKVNATDVIKKALLVSAYKNPKDKEICMEHLEELAFLAETYGVEVLEKIPCLVRKYDSATFVTSGKLEELVSRAKELKSDLVIFDDEIAPSQQRNLETAFGLPVMDRTEVILEVFAQRAQTKEARLQVELAKVRYQAPRLKRLWTHLSRQSGTGSSGGGGAYLKGEGEKQIEIDRRILKKKIDQMQNEIKEVKSIRDMQRSQRVKSEIPVFAIVGYTNVGKSTLLNSLTDANVFVEDKLFATLDTTTRKFTLENNQDILLTDTVGFIRKLPHLLVAAFKSTLEEAVQANVILHVIDASHSMAEEQAAAAVEVLKELGVGDRPIITLLNKIDKCTEKAMITRLKILYPHTIEISALHKLGFENLQEKIIEELRKQRKIVTLRIPQKDYAVVSEIIRLGNILKQDYEENDVILKADLPFVLAGKVKNYIQEDLL